MLSSALRVGHKTVDRKKAREKRAEAEVARQAPAPVEPVGVVEERPVIWKHAALGTAAVGAQLLAMAPIVELYGGVAVSRLLSGRLFEEGLLFGFDLTVMAANAGILLSLLLSGTLFFKRQQRVPMLLNALGWIVLLQFFPNPSARLAWPCIAAALVSLASAFALGERNSDEPETPVQ